MYIHSTFLDILFLPLQGLDRALAEVLPNCEHRYCVQHMYRNFKKKHPGLPLKDRLWNIANSTTEELYNKAMAELKDFDNEAYQWVKNAPAPRHWCKAFFPTHTKSDMLVNNLCESFNAHILEARDQPIITMLEMIREYLMDRIRKRKSAMERYDSPTGPLINEIIENRVKIASQWMPIWNAMHGYQVKGPRGAQFAVDMEKKNCSCRLWEVSGIPCCHAIAAILLRNEDPRQYLNVCYSRGLFLKLYENVLQPISGEDHWPPSTMPELEPPVSVTQPGRPRKARRRDTTEGKNHGRRLRRRIIIHCRKCGEAGHNAATCKQPTNEQGRQDTSTEPVTQQSNVRRRRQTVSTTRHLFTFNFSCLAANMVHEILEVMQSEIPQQQQVDEAAHEQPQQQPGQQQPHEVHDHEPGHHQPQQQQQTSTPGPSEKTCPPTRSRKTSTRKPLTDAEKGAINANYAYLGKEPPYTVGSWRGKWSGRGRGRGGQTTKDKGRGRAN